MDMQYSRSLYLSLKINNGDELVVDIIDPATETASRFSAVYSPDEHPEFDQRIGQEIYNWLQMWQEEE